MTSTIPGVLSELVEVFTAAAPAGFQIGEGGLLDQAPDFLIVGFDDGEQEAVTGSREGADYAMADNAEVYDVENVLSTWSGDTDVPAVRSRLFGYLDTFDSALSAHRMTTPGVARAYITGFALQQPIAGDGEGTTTTLRFTIHIDAWRTP